MISQVWNGKTGRRGVFDKLREQFPNRRERSGESSMFPLDRYFPFLSSAWWRSL